MKAAKKSTKPPKKAPKPGDSTDKSATLPQHVFLYLQPKSITCPLDDIFSDRSEIEVQHQHNTITTLCDHFTARNVVQIHQFDTVKPTFSITIKQDNLEDITMLSDFPILLTLYVYRSKLSDEKIHKDTRVPVAQGYIDIIEYFNNKRARNIETVFLYPLKNVDHSLTCKTEWEIYSLHPLLKTISISNILFVTLGSLYNIQNQELLDDFQNLVAKLSFVAKVPKENNEYDQIVIGTFKTFSKSIIAQQSPNKSWETLKSHQFENINSMGIALESKINVNQLFANLLSTENVELNYNRVNINEDFALVCNSMHRFVLTDDNQKVLEDILSRNLYHIIVEIYSQHDETKVLLQGFIDLSIFMYPEVNNCSFAVELRPPRYKLKIQESSKSGKSKKKNRNANNSNEESLKEENPPFAIIQLELHTPITKPCQDTVELFNKKSKSSKFFQCMTSTLIQNVQTSLSSICDQHYRAFDDIILEILDYIIKNNIKTMDDDKDYFCNQLRNLNNKIMKLVACDFNIKTPTKTNIEFTNLITTVYRDLIARIYNYLNICSLNGLEDCVFTITKVQNFILENMHLAKCLFEVGNLEMANIFMNQLRTEYSNNSMLNFYIFLYDIERQHFELVGEYLKSPLESRDNEGELFVDLIQIYVDYKLQLQDTEKNQTAEEDLIKALSNYSNSHNPRSLTAFILLYCIYKRHNYKAGMEYCRWQYENLYDSLFVKLEFIPKSRWELYMPHKLDLKTSKGQNFFKVCHKLLRLGLYNFAKWVYDEIANECTEMENYFYLKTFMILENKMEDNIPINNFTDDKYTNTTSIKMRATLLLVNGNLEHVRVTHKKASLEYYQAISELKELEDNAPYQLGLLRCAYQMLEEQKYEEASHVFLRLCNDKDICILAAVGRGKACYYLNQLDEAEKYFALSTEYGLYIANTWAYLALINLKKGNNYNALECWKYSKLNRNNEIHDDIINELNKINYTNIFLYVDIPNKM